MHNALRRFRGPPTSARQGAELRPSNEVQQHPPHRGRWSLSAKAKESARHLADVVAATGPHFPERASLLLHSRLTDQTLSYGAADTYFVMHAEYLRLGSARLHAEVFVAFGVTPSLELAGQLLRALRAQGHLAADLSPHSSTERLSEALWRLSNGRDRSAVPLSTQAQRSVAQIVRLHRAEVLRGRLFVQFLAQQRDAYTTVLRLLQRGISGPGIGTDELWRRKQHHQDNLAWALEERLLLPSARAVNGRQPLHGDPLLPAYTQDASPQERSLALYPPPNAWPVLRPPSYRKAWRPPAAVGCSCVCQP